MERRRILLIFSVVSLILASGCVDMAFYTSIDSAGEVEKFQIQLNMTTAMYAMLDGLSTQEGASSFKDAMQNPKNPSGTNQGLDVQEEWDRENGRVKVTMTVRDLPALKNTNYLSVIREGEYMIFRHDLSSSSAASQQSYENPWADQMEKMFTVNYYLTMPGDIVDTNADVVQGNRAEWHSTTAKMPSIYAKSKVTVFSPFVLAGLVAGVFVVMGAIFFGYRFRLRARGMLSDSAETASFRSSRLFGYETTSHPQPFPVDRPQPERAVVPRSVVVPNRIPSIVNKRRYASQTILKTLLISGSILLVVLLGGASIESFMDGTRASGATEASGAPVATLTLLPTPTPNLAPITYPVQVSTASTLSPYSGNSGSDVTRARQTSNPAEDDWIGSEPPTQSSAMVYVTPFPFTTPPVFTIEQRQPTATSLLKTLTPSSTAQSTIVTSHTTTRPITHTTSPTTEPTTGTQTQTMLPAPPENPSLCMCDVDTYNCGDPLAKTCYDYCLAQGKGDVHHLDADNDGIPCEGDPVSPVISTLTTVPSPQPNPETYTITVLSEGIGSVSPSGQVTVEAGKSVTFHMIPDPSVVTPHMTQSGYLVYNLVQIDPTSMEIPDYADPKRPPQPGGENSPPGSFTESYTFPDVQSDHTLRVIFYYGPYFVC